MQQRPRLQRRKDLRIQTRLPDGHTPERVLRGNGFGDLDADE